MLIGLDDTDSSAGMCTTYLAAVLADELKAFGAVADFPFLIRLNPTIPYKTRGNAALGLEVTLFEDTALTRAALVAFVSASIQKYADVDCEQTNPGAVFLFEEAFEAAKPLLHDFFQKAVTDVIEISEATAILSRFESNMPTSVFHFSLKNGRGLIGALAVCGALLNPPQQMTYEYLAYRMPEKCGRFYSERFVDSESLILADRHTTPHTWDTVDFSKKNKPFPVCVPSSPDPVLYGIRGSSPEAVEKAARFVLSEEGERFQIFKTNQGTDAHLIFGEVFSSAQPLHSYIFEGTVHSAAETFEGGHVVFRLADSFGNLLSCAAFEPTGGFRHVIRQLLPGDAVRVYGSFKNETLNLEKIKVLQLAERFGFQNPLCPVCGKRMESAGAGQGFRCRPCKTNAAAKLKISIPRTISCGYYEVPPSARRHLSKPLIRYTEEELQK